MFVLRIVGVLLLVFVLAALIYGLLARDPRVIPLTIKVIRWVGLVAAIGIGLYLLGRLLGLVL